MSVEKSFSNLSLWEVVWEVGIVLILFYCYFKDMDELGLVMVDELGLVFC